MSKLMLSLTAKKGILFRYLGFVSDPIPARCIVWLYASKTHLGNGSLPSFYLFLFRSFDRGSWYIQQNASLVKTFTIFILRLQRELSSLLVSYCVVICEV